MALKLAKRRAIRRDVYALAKERLHVAFDEFDTVAVSFSGGKDSTACLNLALEVAAERGEKGKLIAFHWDEEAIPYETEDYVRRVSKDPRIDLWWLCIPVRHRNACSRRHPFWYPWAPEDREKWVRQLPPEGITELEGYPSEPEKRMSIPDAVGLLFPPKRFGRVGMVLGIRADESITRLRAILSSSNRIADYIIKWEGKTAQGNLYKVYPIYDWRTQDVWTAPAKFGWDYCRAYDVYDKLGIPPDQQRLAPPFGEEPLEGLWQFAHCFPDIWCRMQTRVPGANTAALYARTELYSFGSRPKKPAGMSWEQFIASWVAKHPQPERGQIARKIKDWIAWHYRKTGDPILEVPHPETGMEWDFLLMIAVRGDFKDRKHPNTPNNDEVELRERWRARYEAALREYRSASDKSRRVAA